MRLETLIGIGQHAPMKKVAIASIKENPDKYCPVPEYDGYFVTNDGRLYSTRRYAKEITGTIDKDGYTKVTLVDKDGKPSYLRMHRVVARTFLGKSNLEVNHKDGNKTNNKLSNLEYVTLRENQCHRRGKNVGVCWAKKENKWRAYIQHQKQWHHLGFYENKDDAKRAYVNKIKELGLSLKYAV